jgi:FAD/FMN-containing dehydrogenase
VVRASEDENADLFWGLRGGGGNFGVVTEFEFRLHPVGPLVFAGMVLHPRSEAKALARHYRDFMEQAPDEVGGGLALLTGPPVDEIPEAVRGKPAVGMILVYVGDAADGEEAMRPLLEWGEPALKMVQPMPYTAVQQMIDAGNPKGINDYFKIDFLRELTDEAIDAMVDHCEGISSPFTQVVLEPLGGAVARMDQSKMALSTPDVFWAYHCLTLWMGSPQDNTHMAWARGFVEALKPWSVGVAYPNFIEFDEGEARLRASYGDKNFERLVKIKDEYDPDNVFSLNQNIPPTLGGVAGG